MSVDRRTVNACEMRNVNGALIGRDRFNKMCSSLAAEVNTICLDPINDCHAARSVGPRPRPPGGRATTPWIVRNDGRGGITAVFIS